MSLHPGRLRLLVQLETLGTVRAVALAVNQSASSVSQQLAVLETEAGTALLERTGRRVRLTTAGHVLVGRSREILDLITETEAELRVLGDEPAGIVRVAAFQSAIHSLVVPTSTALRAAHPLVEVHVEEREPHESTSTLLRGDADIAVTTTDFLDLPRHRGIHLVPLTTDAIVLVAPRGHWVERQEKVEPAALAEESWVLDVEGSYMSDLTTRLCRHAGFEPRVVGRLNNYLLTLRHVETTGTVALLPALTLDPGHDVVAREIVPRTVRRITAAVRTSSTPRASVGLVLDALRIRAHQLRGA
ncbi:LysR family transcriptional regulator [Aeromicrobium sp. CF4.19]|uniref:LysR family transcriptional regulator n=1 Tax=Aeromicrobium sp. CF4.19 TaxID=3373082 RepID=UPI003EE72FBF